MRPGIRTVLGPKWRSAYARLRQTRSGTGPRVILFILLSFGFWSAVFNVAYRTLRYTKGVAEIGNELASKGLEITLLAFGSILLLSNLVTALSTFFLAKDLDFLVAAPIDWLKLYLAKLGETVLHSSWMVILLAIPVLTAYGIVYQGGPLFPIVALAAFVPFLVLPAVIGSSITLILVNVFPARRARDLLTLLAIGAAGGVVLLLRLIRPERLARPEGFRNLLDFIAVLRTPTNPFLPSEWAADMIMNWLLRVGDPLPVALLWTTAAASVVLGAALHHRLYLTGYSKAQEGADVFVRGRSWTRWVAWVLRRLEPSEREFILKDLRLFFRDTTQWSQLILLAVLVVVYVFNIRALPLFSGERVSFLFLTMIAFLNQGLSGFILAAIAARFIFPAVSLEGRQMWLLRSSPLDLRALLWSKYWSGTIPLLVLAIILTWATNQLLRIAPFMFIVNIATVVLLTLAIAALALGFGALYPQFETENAAQIPTSFGGLVFMMTAVTLLGVVIMLEAVPVTAYLRARQAGVDPGFTLNMGAAFVAVFLICAAATVIPLRIGLRRMLEMEF